MNTVAEWKYFGLGAGVSVLCFLTNHGAWKIPFAVGFVVLVVGAICSAYEDHVERRKS